jgi:hypothetical protein
MSKFYVSVTNGFVTSADRDSLCHIIKSRLIAHYGTESAAFDAYMDHWDRLQDGDTSAELGSDSWSDAWNAAQDCLLDGWHNAPDCMFEVVLS